jgi:3-oxoacyl-[acyl-carrier-protein] synthase II
MGAREVAVAGLGLVSALGATVEENWANLAALQTGIGRHPRADAPRFAEYLGKVTAPALPAAVPERLAGQVRFLSRGSLFGLRAALEAVAQAGSAWAAAPPHRRALYVASGDLTKIGCESLFPAISAASAPGWRATDAARLNAAALGTVNPFFLLESLHNNLFSFLSAWLECTGPHATLASLSPCGGHALELAARAIRLGRADVAVAVGCGSWVNEIALFELDGLGLASQCRDGAASFRPLDRRRDGFIAGEGGAALVLQAAEDARAAGAAPFARIRGTGNCVEFVPGKPLAVPQQVSRRCMELALAAAGCGADELAFIAPHGSGTRSGDASEIRSIAGLLEQQRAGAVPVSALKAYTGHLGAASDIAEAILGIVALRQGLVPATLNFAEPDRALPALDIAGAHRPTTKRAFLSVSYGVGGQCASLVADVGWHR